MHGERNGDPRSYEQSDRERSLRDHTIEYTVDGVRLTVPVTDGGVKGIDIRTPLGTEVPIWYDPQNPRHVIISEEPFVNVTADSWKRTQKRALKWMLVSLALSILFFFLSVK